MNQSIYHRRFYKGPIYSCIGSVMGWYETPRTIVWGSGMIKEDVILRVVPKKICAVRGEESRSRLIAQGVDCPKQIGDPALLISQYYTPKPYSKRYKIGVIPHYVDLDNPILGEFINRHIEDVLLIDMVNYDVRTDVPNKIVPNVCICGGEQKIFIRKRIALRRFPVLKCVVLVVLAL